MGLDMYLTKKTYVGANYEHNKVTGTVELFADSKKLNIKLNRISSIIESVGYWRKATHIHNWFVQNVQDGIDECEEHSVTEEHFKKLLETCKMVLKDNSKAEKLLPVKAGFSFGNTECDKYYFEQIKQTIEILEDVLNEIKESEDFCEYFYRSSW